MRLNLGCGGDSKTGFVNIDIAGGDIKHDLTTGLPENIGPGTVDYIYTSHFLEHLHDQDTIELLKTCYSALKPGGVIRICLPDFKKLAVAYVNGDDEFFKQLPLTSDCNISFLEYCAYQYDGKNNDHKALYDIHKIIHFLKNAGFIATVEKQFDKTIDVDCEVRVKYSLYVEGIKKKLIKDYMGGKNVAFAITVHNRLAELRMQNTLIRNEFGKLVDIHVFCNCSEGESVKYKGMLEDSFNWCENTGHAQGSIDHPNMAVSLCPQYDYIILMAAKQLWTDYSLISRVVEDMVRTGKEIAVFKDNGGGHFNDPNQYAFYCDFMVFSTSLYEKIFPLPKVEQSQFPERMITDKVLATIGGKDNVFYIPCKSPPDNDKIYMFTEIYDTQEAALSIKELPDKLKRFNEKSKYNNLFNSMLVKDF